MKDINKTKRKFEKALLTLLEEKNYRDITINEICASVNKTKMTFYHYYKNKENLLTQASINLVNSEYGEEYNKILSRETGLEEIEYQAILVTYEWIAQLFLYVSTYTIKEKGLTLLYQSYVSKLGRDTGVGPVHVRFTAECVHRFTNRATA